MFLSDVFDILSGYPSRYLNQIEKLESEHIVLSTVEKSETKQDEKMKVEEARHLEDSVGSVEYIQEENIIMLHKNN